MSVRRNHTSWSTGQAAGTVGEAAASVVHTAMVGSTTGWQLMAAHCAMMTA